MPDGISSYSTLGMNLIITANEGDGRPPDFVQSGHPLFLRDDPRVSDLTLDPGFKAELDALYGGANATANSRLGRLRVSRFDSDTDGDGDADQLIMFGTRSFTIWNADTGDQIWDSGSFFETYIAANHPDLFNSEGTPASFDGRSPNQGPDRGGNGHGDLRGPAPPCLRAVGDPGRHGGTTVSRPARTSASAPIRMTGPRHSDFSPSDFPLAQAPIPWLIASRLMQ